MGTHRTFIATYIMGSGRNGTLYVGMTSNLFARVWRHKTRTFPGFTNDYACDRLVWSSDTPGSRPRSGARSG